MLARLSAWGMAVAGCANHCCAQNFIDPPLAGMLQA